MEIQRLIGRSLRAVVDLAALGPRTVTVDCDVIQADGGTRTASITGAFVALCLALDGLRRRGAVTALPLMDQVAAVSVGLLGEQLLLDLDYAEDSQAHVDANFVGTGIGDLVEVQLSGEGGPFPAARLNQMLSWPTRVSENSSGSRRRRWPRGSPYPGDSHPQSWADPGTCASSRNPG